MNTQQLIALLQSLDPTGKKEIKFQNRSGALNTGDEVDIIGADNHSTKIDLYNSK